MNKLILVILLCSVSFSNIYSQDVFGSGKNIRKGTKANLPTLAEGELYFATDANMLYMGLTGGLSRAVFLDTTTVATASDTYIGGMHTITTSTEMVIDCSKEKSIIIQDNYVGSTSISFQNIIAGITYTLRIHSVDGDYAVDFPGKTGNWVDPANGFTDIVPSVNATDVFNFTDFGEKIYSTVYGQGY